MTIQLSYLSMRTVLIMLFFLFLLFHNAYTQSILLIESDAIVYDTYKEERLMKLRLKDNLWVNYKGKQGNFIRISNYFGPDHEYPNGIFDGFVSVTSVLDTAKRKDYAELQLNDSPTIEIIESPAPANRTFKTDIADFYIGMSKNDALALSKSSFTLGDNRYGLDLSFSSLGRLSELILEGKAEDAMAVDSSIKQQVDELRVMLRSRYGTPIKSNPYPSFLEIEVGNTFQVATWRLPGKSVNLGVAEKNDLYYAVVSVKEN